jgi:TonB-dependent SusC/RagA subfamily outer membrane receptor
MSGYFLHIDEACTEKWDKMTQLDNGKFCNNCNKTVFDFTTATDNEIIKHIESMKGKMFCGRFEEGQLDRWVEKSNIKTTNPSLYKYLLSFILLTGGQSLYAQHIAAQEKIVLKQKADSTLNASILKSEVPDEVCDTAKRVVVKETRIRMGAVRTLTGNNEPLIILDGTKCKIPMLGKLAPEKIKSIEIMKSSTATALYGSEGANGVIIITSKYSEKEIKKLSLK